MRPARAFTLIELLIVVAIIAILAAIAVPNFLEAQTRAKVSRVKADLRSVATALESYIVDWNFFPPDEGPVPGTQYRLEAVSELSTPIAYITSAAIRDPFNNSATGIMGNLLSSFQYFNFSSGGSVQNWGDVALMTGYPEFQTRTAVLKSWGPDRTDNGLEWVIMGLAEFAPTSDPNGDIGINRVYDPTNGTISAGDVGRFVGDTHGIAQQL
jgi:prepilin-type N-terminal cleavage/methylation domain-containing protein